MPEPIDLKQLRYATIKDVRTEMYNEYDVSLTIEFFDGRKIWIVSDYEYNKGDVYTRLPQVHAERDEE